MRLDGEVVAAWRVTYENDLTKIASKVCQCRYDIKEIGTAITENQYCFMGAGSEDFVYQSRPDFDEQSHGDRLKESYQRGVAVRAAVKLDNVRHSTVGIESALELVRSTENGDFAFSPFAGFRSNSPLD
jgi:hypothetical protein